jgi:hypothetical protein
MPIAALIQGAENLIDDRIRYANANGLSHRVGAPYRLPSAPWRFVGHTIEAPETWALSTLRNAAITHRTPPHLWASPTHDWVGQTVPLNLSAYALKHRADDPETNHAHAVQVEVLGYARDMPYREHADWIGRRVLRPIIDAGVPINLRVVARSDGPNAYGESGSVRFTWAQWARFDGLCSHQNVPGNQHWDVGFADFVRIAQAASNPSVPPIPVPMPTEAEDPMMILERSDATGHAAWLVGGGPPRKLTNEERTTYRTMKDEDGNDLCPKVGRTEKEMMLIIHSELKRFDMELEDVD